MKISKKKITGVRLDLHDRICGPSLTLLPPKQRFLTLNTVYDPSLLGGVWLVAGSIKWCFQHNFGILCLGS